MKSLNQFPKLVPAKPCRGFDSHFPLKVNSLARKELGSFF